MLKDSLMLKTVETQLLQFNCIGERGKGSWLQARWSTFAEAGSETPGQLHHFIDQMLRSDREMLFVRTTTIRQGSPSNPYLRQKPAGYHMEIDPGQIALRLMRCRESLAVEWREELAVLSNCDRMGVEHEALPDAGFLSGLATRVALRRLSHDLSLLPSRAPVLDYLDHFILRETAAADAAAIGTGTAGVWADGGALLRKLAAQPLLIRGSALIDPQHLAAEATLLRAEVEALMADALEETTEEHLSTQASFLDDCFAA
jgi:hypothetical protein